MKRILLDENVPVGLTRLLRGSEVLHVHDQGWTGTSNGELFEAAERAGFDVMITADRNLRYQQNLGTRHLALVVLPTNNWNAIRHNAAAVDRAIRLAEPGSYLDVTFSPA